MTGRTDELSIISREEAMARGLKRYFAGEPCKHGHITERRVRFCACLECDRLLAAKRRAADPEAASRWRAANRERVREYQRKNADKIRRQRAERYAANKDRVLSRQRAAITNEAGMPGL
jgi:hypothetical protein